MTSMDAMGQFREEVMWSVTNALDAMGVKVQFELEAPDPEKADLAVPCFPMAKALRKNPVEIANEIVAKLQPMPTIEKMWADRGYLNFKVNEEFLAASTVREILTHMGSFGNGTVSQQSSCDVACGVFCFLGSALCRLMLTTLPVGSIRIVESSAPTDLDAPSKPCGGFAPVRLS